MKLVFRDKHVIKTLTAKHLYKLIMFPFLEDDATDCEGGTVRPNEASLLL